MHILKENEKQIYYVISLNSTNNFYLRSVFSLLCTSILMYAFISLNSFQIRHILCQNANLYYSHAIFEENVWICTTDCFAVLCLNIRRSDIYCETWISQSDSRAIGKTNLHRRTKRQTTEITLENYFRNSVCYVCANAKCLYTRNRRYWMYLKNGMHYPYCLNSWIDRWETFIAVINSDPERKSHIIQKSFNFFHNDLLDV